MNKTLSLIALSAFALASCNHHEGWKIKGNVPIDTKMVVLEQPSASGGWFAADSVAPDAKGDFILRQPRAKGSIYRLIIDGKATYLPADSVETVELNVSPSGETRLSGSESARLFSAIDSIIRVAGDTATRPLLKLLDGKYASLAAYYATRQCSSPTLLRTILNRHMAELPNDPRTLVLMAEYNRTRPKTETQPGQQVIIEAPETSYFEIELMDRYGQMQKLSSVVDNAPVAILAFVDFTSSSAPAVNIALGEAFNKGAAIYQVGFDENQQLWANATAELPWTAVYQSETSDATPLREYMVSELPTFFLFRNGEITQRISDPSKLKDI